MKRFICINKFVLYKLNDCIFDIMLEMYSTFIAQNKEIFKEAKLWMIVLCQFFIDCKYYINITVKIVQNNCEFPGQRNPLSEGSSYLSIWKNYKVKLFPTWVLCCRTAFLVNFDLQFL